MPPRRQRRRLAASDALSSSAGADVERLGALRAVAAAPGRHRRCPRRRRGRRCVPAGALQRRARAARSRGVSPRRSGCSPPRASGRSSTAARSPTACSAAGRSCADQVPLPDGEGRPSPRNALVATIGAPSGQMTVVSTHLHHRLDGSTVRQAQTRALAELVAVRQRRDRLPADPRRRSECDPRQRRASAADRPGAARRRSSADRRLGGRWGQGRGDTWSSTNPYVSDSLAWPASPTTCSCRGRAATDRQPCAGSPGRCGSGGGVYASDHFAVVVDLHAA